MRYVLRPEPLRVGEAEFGLGQLLMYYVDNAVRFVSGQRGIRSGMRIADAIRDFETEKLGFLALEEDDWTALRDELEAPKLLKVGDYEQPPFPISPARNCLRFIDAMADAKTEKPKCEPPPCPPESAATAPRRPRKRGGGAPEPGQT